MGGVARKVTGASCNRGDISIKVAVRACYGAYFGEHVFKYLAPNFVSGRPA